MEATQHSPGLRRMAGLVGGETSFERGRVLLDELAGVALTAKAVEREAEAIGAAIAAREQTEIDRAIQLDLPETGGAARTREVKLGCVFTQSGRDARGRPLRDEGSTSYTGAIEDAAAFGRRLSGRFDDYWENRARAA